MSSRNVFVIGATGFVGGHLVAQLAEKHPDYHLICLLRNPTPARIAGLEELNRNVEVLEGTLDDFEIISKKSEEVDVVIHLAHSDHLPSVEAVLDGLTNQKAKNPEREPIYLHMSGMGIICDNVYGEKVDYVKEWTDIDLDLDDCPPNNTHLPCDRKILEAGTRNENRIRTCIVFPSIIYGMGKAGRSTNWIAIFDNLARQAGRSGTWGPGEVFQDPIHVRDVASASIFVLDAMVDGKVNGGKDALFFIASDEPPMSWKDILSVLGDVLHARGIIKEPGAWPFPPEVTEPFGHYGWSLLGSNAHARSDRLRALGWDDEWSKRESIQSLMPKMMEVGIADACTQYSSS